MTMNAMNESDPTQPRPAPVETGVDHLPENYARLVAEKEAVIARLEQELAESEKLARRLKNELDEITASKSWQLALRLRNLRLKLMPPNSRLEKLLRMTNRRHLEQAARLTAVQDPAQLSQVKDRFRHTARRELELFLMQGDRLERQTVSAPLLSILLVVYNQAELTFACLRSLLKEVEDRAEILVVDNASTDDTPALLKRISGIRVIRNETNIGFIRAVNQGVPAARGKFVLLLNNDTRVHKGSLARALSVIESDPQIGAVGARVLQLDGFLQEAGSLVWDNGDCYGYGRGRDAGYDAAMFRRDVDFCSGAFLLTRRDLFLELGGFDERLAPAYFEDADYCLRLWQRGMRVVYDPRVSLDHFEFGSIGSSEAAVAQMATNRSLFLSKHHAELKTHYPPSEHNLLAARARPGHKGRILFIDDMVPLPIYGAGLPRSRSILQIFHHSGYFVTIYPMTPAQEDWDLVYKYLPEEIEVILSGSARRIEAFMEERRGYYDILFVSRPHNAALLNRLHRERPELFQGMFIIYDAEAIWVMRKIEQARAAGRPFPPARISRMVSAEISAAGFADRILVVNEAEASPFSMMFSEAPRQAGKPPPDIHILSHAVAARPTPAAFDTRRDFLFIGRLVEDHSPNVDSVVWFAREIFPHIRSALDPSIRLLVVGLIESRRIRALSSTAGVELIGPVEELEPWYNRARVFVAPTRFSAGIPLKVHEAVSYGLPCVITPLLARQLDWEPECGVLIGRDELEFASRCVQLYTDPAAWEKVRNRGLEMIRANYSYEAFAEKVRQVVEER